MFSLKHIKMFLRYYFFGTMCMYRIIEQASAPFKVGVEEEDSKLNLLSFFKRSFFVHYVRERKVFNFSYVFSTSLFIFFHQLSRISLKLYFVHSSIHVSALQIEKTLQLK